MQWRAKSSVDTKFVKKLQESAGRHATAALVEVTTVISPLRCQARDEVSCFALQMTPAIASRGFEQRKVEQSTRGRVPGPEPVIEPFASAIAFVLAVPAAQCTAEQSVGAARNLPQGDRHVSEAHPVVLLGETLDAGLILPSQHFSLVVGGNVDVAEFQQGNIDARQHSRCEQRVEVIELARRVAILTQALVDQDVRACHRRSVFCPAGYAPSPDGVSTGELAHALDEIGAHRLVSEKNDHAQQFISRPVDIEASRDNSILRQYHGRQA
jgi:hypothetical protein